MNFEWSEEQARLRESILQFAENELNDNVAQRDRAQVFSRELWDKCGKMGLLGLPVPEEYGGSKLDALSTALGLEALGYGCRDGGLVFSLGARRLCSVVVPIWKFGSAEQKRHYLPGLCSGR